MALPKCGYKVIHRARVYECRDADEAAKWVAEFYGSLAEIRVKARVTLTSDRDVTDGELRYITDLTAQRLAAAGKV